MIRNPARAFVKRSEKVAKLFKKALDAQARRKRNPTPAAIRRADKAFAAFARAQ